MEFSLYVNSLECKKSIKGGESEYFRIDHGVKQGCIVFPWLFNVYYGCSEEKDENGDGEDGSKISGRSVSGDCPVSCWQMT